jgi:hypothetical protein
MEMYERQKKYYHRNREKIREKQLAYQREKAPERKAFYWDNREEILMYNKIMRTRNITNLAV